MHLTRPTFIRLIEFLTCNCFILFTVPQAHSLPCMVSSTFADKSLFTPLTLRYILGTNFSSENLPHPMGVPYSLNNFSSTDISMERMKTDRSNGLTQSSSLRTDPVANFNRKRALSSSPYPDLLDVSSMIRYSPSSLYGSKSSNASGSFGHLGATALNATSASATNASIGTPMSISSLPTSLQHFLISGELLPSLSGHYISPSNSMFSLAHHQAMASSLMQMDASMQSLKSVSSAFLSRPHSLILIFFPGIIRATCSTTKAQLVKFKELEQKIREQLADCNISRSRQSIADATHEKNENKIRNTKCQP